MGKPRKSASRIPAAPAHNLLSQYDLKAKTRPRTDRALIEIDDPMGLPVGPDGVVTHEASAVPAPIGSISITGGPTSWQAPVRRRITVLASIRSDVAAGMFARRQIDRACFVAARQYQQLAELAASVKLKSCDMSLGGRISGSRAGDYDGVDVQLRAARDLKRIEEKLAQRHGVEGLKLIREVLGAGSTIEQAARARGETTKDRVGWWGGLFRRCLRCLAVVLGLAMPGAYQNRHKHGNGTGKPQPA